MNNPTKEAKKCTVCGEAKPLASFGKGPRYKGGYVSRCKDCTAAYARKWRKRNPDKCKRNRKKRQGKQAAYAREYYSRNQEKLKAYSRTYQQKHRARDRDKKAALELIRKARKLGAFVERVYRSVVWKRDSGTCYLCGTKCDKDNWHLDHKTPLVRGGDHSYLNTGVTCPPCNLSKGAMTPTEWRDRWQ